MSVNSWNRELSNIQFLYKTYQLNGLLVDIMSNFAKKYKDSYESQIINAGLDAYESLYLANLIRVDENMSIADYKERKQLLKNGIAKLDKVCMCTQIFVDRAMKSDGTNKEFAEKSMERIASSVTGIKKLIYGVLKKDDERFKEYKKKSK